MIITLSPIDVLENACKARGIELPEQTPEYELVLEELLREWEYDQQEAADALDMAEPWDEEAMSNY